MIHFNHAAVVELAYTYGLGPYAARLESSSLSRGTRSPGPVAHPVERSIRIAEVGSSSLPRSTNFCLAKVALRSSDVSRNEARAH